MENQPIDLVALRKRANEHLFELIRELLPSAQWEGAVKCGDLPIQAACTDVWASDDLKVFSLGFALLLEAEQGLVIRERAAGFGDDVDGALRFAVLAWVTSVFVTATCLYEPQGHPGHMASLVERPFLTEGGEHRIWKVVSSPTSTFSLEHKDKVRPNNVKAPETLSSLEPLLQRLTVHNKLYWIKVFLAKNAAGIDIDCSLNTEKSPEINLLFSRFSWPRGTDLQYIRQFHILKPTDAFATSPAKGNLFGFLRR